MITTHHASARDFLLALYFNDQGMMVAESMHEEEGPTFDLTHFDLKALVREFVLEYKNPTENRILYPEAEDCERLIDVLKACVEIAEKALYDDEFPNAVD